MRLTYSRPDNDLNSLKRGQEKGTEQANTKPQNLAPQIAHKRAIKK